MVSGLHIRRQHPRQLFAPRAQQRRDHGQCIHPQAQAHRGDVCGCRGTPDLAATVSLRSNCRHQCSQCRRSSCPLLPGAHQTEKKKKEHIQRDCFFFFFLERFLCSPPQHMATTATTHHNPPRPACPRAVRYSPTLNPIELGFNDLKKMIRRFRRRFRRPTGANSDAATFELMGLIPQKNWWGYFHSAGVCPPWQSEAAELTSLLLLQVLQLQLRDY